MPVLTQAWRVLLRPRGDRRWDMLVRGAGIVALIGVPIAYSAPGSAPLVWFALVSVPANSPLSPILPTAFEPVIMEAAKYASTLSVAVVGTAVYMLMEYLNYHLYAWVLTRDRFVALREKKWVRRSVGSFARAPFGTVFVFAFTPLPFWVARILSIYRGYSVPRFMSACALGRFPRILLYAELGAALVVPSVLLALVAVGTGGLVVAWKVVGGKAILEDTVLDTEIEPSQEIT